MFQRGSCGLVVFIFIILTIYLNEVEGRFSHIKNANNQLSKLQNLGNSLKKMMGRDESNGVNQHDSNEHNQPHSQEKNHGKGNKGGKDKKGGRRDKKGGKGNKKEHEGSGDHHENDNHEKNNKDHHDDKNKVNDESSSSSSGNSGDSSSSSSSSETENDANIVVGGDVTASCTFDVTGYLNSACTLGGVKSTYTSAQGSCYQGDKGNWAKYECYPCSSGNKDCIWVYTSTTQSECTAQATQSNFVEYKLNTCTKNSAVIGYYSKINFNYATCCGSVTPDQIQQIIAAH